MKTTASLCRISTDVLISTIETISIQSKALASSTYERPRFVHSSELHEACARPFGQAVILFWHVDVVHHPDHANARMEKHELSLVVLYLVGWGSGTLRTNFDEQAAEREVNYRIDRLAFNRGCFWSAQWRTGLSFGAAPGATSATAFQSVERWNRTMKSTLPAFYRQQPIDAVTLRVQSGVRLGFPLPCAVASVQPKPTELQVLQAEMLILHLHVPVHQKPGTRFCHVPQKGSALQRFHTNIQVAQGPT